MSDSNEAQPDTFEEAARAVGCGEDEAGSDEAPRKVATAKLGKAEGDPPAGQVEPLPPQNVGHIGGRGG